jgi:DNA-binding response OmpR family regulator
MGLILPTLDGISTSRVIRDKSFGSNPYIIGFSDHCHLEDKQKCLDVGMNSFLERPFKINELKKVLANIDLKHFEIKMSV